MRPYKAGALVLLCVVAWILCELLGSVFKVTPSDPNFATVSTSNLSHPDPRYHDFDPEYWRVHIVPPDTSSVTIPPDDCPFLTHPTPDAIPLFRQLLRDDSGMVRACVLTCVFKLGKQAEPLVPDVAKAFDDDRQTFVRLMSFGVLRSLGPIARQAVPTLVEALQDEHLDIRFYAVDALIAIDTKNSADRVIPVLREVIANKKYRQIDRCDAIVRLKYFPFADARVSSALLDVLNDPEDSGTEVAKFAALAIGQCGQGSPQAIVALQSVLKTAPLGVRVEAACALYNLTGDGRTCLPVLLNYCATSPNYIDFSWPAISTLALLAKQHAEAVDGLVLLCGTRKKPQWPDRNELLRWLTHKAPEIAAIVEKRINSPPMAMGK
jgi:hypothetical protein